MTAKSNKNKNDRVAFITWIVIYAIVIAEIIVLVKLKLPF